MLTLEREESKDLEEKALVREPAFSGETRTLLAPFIPDLRVQNKNSFDFVFSVPAVYELEC